LRGCACRDQKKEIGIACREDTKLMPSTHEGVFAVNPREQGAEP